MKKVFFILLAAWCCCFLVSCEKSNRNEPSTNESSTNESTPSSSYYKDMTGKTMTLALSELTIQISFTSNTSGTIVIADTERSYDSMVYTQTGESSATLQINSLDHSLPSWGVYLIRDLQLALFYIDDNHGTVNGTCTTTYSTGKVSNVAYTYDSFTVF